MRYKDKKIASIALVMLLVAFAIVYVIFLQVKGDKLFDQDNDDTQIIAKDNPPQKQADENDSTLNQEDDTKSPQDIQPQKPTTSNPDKQVQNSKDSKILTGSSQSMDMTGDISTGQVLQDTYYKILPGTVVYTGELPILQELGLYYEYILKGDNSVYVAFLDHGPQNLKSAAERLSGNINVLDNPAQIQGNKLIGQEIVFINSPKYEGDKVIFVLKIMNPDTRDYWLVQVDTNKYHEYKDYIRSLFNY